MGEQRESRYRAIRKDESRKRHGIEIHHAVSQEGRRGEERNKRRRNRADD